MFHTREFTDDQGRKLEVDCTLASEGRDMGIYVIEYCAWLYSDRDDKDAPEIKLTDAEWERLNEEVCACERANETWRDRD